jgi:hypothetical protein
MSHQAGFAAVEGFIIAVVIVGLAGGGYTVWHRQQTKTSAAQTSTMTKLGYDSPAVTTPNAPAITSNSGLSSALQTLNETDVSAGSQDSAQLATQSAGFQAN